MAITKHQGRNVRSIRRLLSMKQEAFAMKMDVTQQYISKLENQKSISSKILEDIAKVLGVSVETIENFDESTFVNSAHPQDREVLASMLEMIDNFKDGLLKMDSIISKLTFELEGYRTGRIQPKSGEADA